MNEGSAPTSRGTPLSEVELWDDRQNMRLKKVAVKAPSPIAMAQLSFAVFACLFLQKC